MCVGREREKAAIGEFMTGVVSASHGLALIGRSTGVRGGGAVDDLLPRVRPWREQRRRELLLWPPQL
jgi:hypothetical protein